MKILIVGGGGREHAIAAAVARSPKADKIYCAPGNAGIAEVAECVPLGVDEFDKIASFAKEKEVDLVIVGPDVLWLRALWMSLRQRGCVCSAPGKMRRFWKEARLFPKI